MIISKPDSIVSNIKIENIKNNIAYANKLDGEFWECGVYRGGTAAILAELSTLNRKIVLIDSFEGVSEPQPEIDCTVMNWQKGRFGDVDYQNIVNYFSKYPNVKIIKEWIPKSFEGLENSKIAYCHLDVDLYQPYKDCLEFIWPRLVVGGVMLFDDYDAIECPGAKKAVDDFFKDKHETSTLNDFDQNKHYIKKTK